MKLIDFYKSVLESLNLIVSDDGYVKIDAGGKHVMFTINGKPLTLPTQEHIKYAIDVDDNGKFKVNRVLYNVLNEDVIKGDSISLRKSKDIAEKMLAHGIYAVGELLLSLAENPKLQTKTSMELNNFLGDIAHIKTKQMKHLVDPKTINGWKTFYDKSLESKAGLQMIKIYLKKGGIDKNKKYNRLNTTSFPLYEELMNSNKDDVVSGVTLRKKDVELYNVLFDFILKDMLDEKHHMTYGSNDTLAPGFVALFKVYVEIAVRLNKLLTSLKFINEELYDSAFINLQVASDDLDKISVFENELKVIPNELELNKNAASLQTTVTQIEETPEYTPPKSLLGNVAKPKLTESGIPENNNIPANTTVEDDPVMKILYGNPNLGPQPTIVPYQQPQPMIQPMQQPMTQPMQQPVYQPQVQQPMYQSPNQQPMYQPQMQSNMYQQPGMYQRPMGKMNWL